MIHKVKLKNDVVILLIEENSKLVIAMQRTGAEGLYKTEDCVKSNVCSIDKTGVTVMTNSGEASYFISNNLKQEDPVMCKYDICFKSIKTDVSLYWGSIGSALLDIVKPALYEHAIKNKCILIIEPDLESFPSVDSLGNEL